MFKRDGVKGRLRDSAALPVLATFENTAAGYLEAINLFTTHGVVQVGVEGSAKWGAHVAIALVAAGFDTREIPASRSAARADQGFWTRPTPSMPSPPLAQCWPNRHWGRSRFWGVYDLLVAEIEAVLEHR